MTRPIILYKLREVGFFPPRHPAQRWANAMLKILERDGHLHSKLPDFVVTSCMVNPYISYDAERPDGVEINVTIRGVSRERHRSR